MAGDENAPSDTHVGFGRFKVKLPESRVMRLLLGTGLCIGGMLWFLPVLGIWMLPLGIIVLAVDIALLRPVRDVVHRWLVKLETMAGMDKK